LKVLIVIPAYDEARILEKTVGEVRDLGVGDVLVVDDGSGDGTCDVARRLGVMCVRHEINLGLGAALETGFEVARRRGYDALVTFDADGQHNPQDVKKLLGRLGEADLIVGVRRIHFENMPPVKKLGNTLLNLLTFIFFGVYSSDSQSGLRVLSRRAFEGVRIRARRYEVSSEILYEAGRCGLRILEVPVEVIYTDYSIERGTGVSDGLGIFWRMLLHRRRR
jgi:UDP-N-acetylglucosamine---dolichyl-phosphate N-acetylglucosaminyltransferase